ncbi:MAG: hypothetical protein ACPGVB_12040 [Chitinophagales bacterium]
MIQFRFISFWMSAILLGTLLTFSSCKEDDMSEPEPPIEEPAPNDVRFQLRGGSFGEQNIVFEKTEGTISKTGYNEDTGTTRLYTLSPQTNSNQNDIIDIYLPFTPNQGIGQYVLEDVKRQSKLEDFNIYVGGTKQVSLETVTVEIDEYGDIGGRIKGRFFGRGLDESIGAVGVIINFGEFDMLRTF